MNAARFRVYMTGHCHPTGAGQVGSPLEKIKKRGIPPEYKAQADNFLKMGLKPSHAYYRQFKLSVDEQADGRVRLIDFQRRRVHLLKTNPSALKPNSIGDLITFCEEHELNPGLEPHSPGVLPGWVVTPAEEGREQVVNITLTTNYLMGVLDEQRNGHLPAYATCDYTYKMLANNLPVNNHGTVDANLRYWDTALLSITSNEQRETIALTLSNMKQYMHVLGYGPYEVKYTCPDNDRVTRTAWADVFPDITVATCWAHWARKAGGEHRHLLRKTKNVDKIFKDLRVLHSYTDNECRDQAINLYVKKWEKKEPQYVSTMQKGWLNEHSRGFNVGATAPGLPNSNQGVERSNRSLKQFVTGHYRMNMTEFLKAATLELEHLSRESGCKEFPHTPTISRAHWLDAQDWINQAKGSFGCALLIKTKLVRPLITVAGPMGHTKPR
jgi:hypothetical protein